MTLRVVTFKWDDLFGDCYECGNPAAFELLERPYHRLCSVCAANAAADGEPIKRLFVED